jgi:hypothetical protein
MSAAIWSTPQYPFTGDSQYVDWTKIPKSIGTDFFNGKRNVDLYKTVLDSTKKPPEEKGIYGGPAQYDTKDARPSIEDIVKANVKYQTEMLPIQYQGQLAQAGLTRQLNLATMSDLYPFLSAAGAEQTARALGASEYFLKKKEQMPSSVQNIMASKQSQMQSAQLGESELQRATAAQQLAAAPSGFGGRFAGQYVQFG